MKAKATDKLLANNAKIPRRRLVNSFESLI